MTPARRGKSNKPEPSAEFREPAPAKRSLRGALACLLPVLPTDEIDPSGRRQSLRLSAAVARSFGGWVFDLFLVYQL